MIVTTARKERERLEREARILAIARRRLAEGGYLGLSMARIAEEVEYSYGTVYQHFPCKEEIILAVAVEMMEERCSYFERASRYPGRSRERLTAVGLAAQLYAHFHPDCFSIEMILRAPSIWEKTSEERRQRLRSLELKCLGINTGIVRDGVAGGDLTLPADLTPEDMVFGLWSLTMGGHALIATNQSLQELGIRDPAHAVLRNAMILLDGYGWRPLASEYDYWAVFHRAAETLFPEESRRAGVLPKIQERV